MEAIGRRVLGMTEDAFWRSTPRQFDALLKQHLEQERREDYRAGVVAALVANSIPSKKRKRPYKPEDFFPSLKRKGGGG